jgi:Cellulase (glycosyl hydrolase family 5)
VVGNHVLDGRGHVWMPYGISLFGGLEDGDRNARWVPTLGSAMAQIRAAPLWSANDVRIQWSEASIFHDRTPGFGVNVPFLMALCAQVRQVRSQGEVAVLNDQTEFPDWGEVNPTIRTEQAWRVVIDEFGNQPGIIADLYNEPRMRLNAVHRSPTTANVDWLWHVWQHGGEVNGRQYIGMQQLVDYTRRAGFQGVEWIEAPFLHDLDRATRYPIHDPDHNIVWSFHHMPLPLTAASGDTTTWDRAVGYLTAYYPVVDGEWNQSAGTTAECAPDAYAVVPAYLRYLRRKGIGINIWSLQPGSMVAEPHHGHARASNITQPNAATSPEQLTKPSEMAKDYACDTRHIGEGVGHWMLNYFRRYSDFEDVRLPRSDVAAGRQASP